MDSPEKPKTRVIYTPPASDVVNAYTKMVCQRLGEDFTHPDVVREFTQFVKIAVAFKARRLNEGEKVDNEKG